MTEPRESVCVVLLGLVAFGLGGTLSFSAAANESSDKQRITELESRIRVLEDENQRMRKELQTLRALGLGGGTGSTSKPSDRGPASAPEHRAGVPATRPGQAVDFVRPQQILEALPQDLRMKPVVGWDKFTLPKVEDWLGREVVGKSLEARLVPERIEVDRIAGATDAKRSWRVTAYCPREGTFVYVGLSHTTRLTEDGSRAPGSRSRRGGVTPYRRHDSIQHELETDEATARQFDRKGARDARLAIRAKITGLTVSPPSDDDLRHRVGYEFVFTIQIESAVLQ